MAHEFLPSVEESYHRLLEHIPGMAYRCRVEKARGSEQGFEYVLEFVSRGSFDLLGIPAGDMIEQNQNVIERMTHPDDLPRQRQSIYDKVVMGQPYQAMYRLILPGGRVKWVWDQGEGVTGPDGGLWYLEGLMMDVSEQKFMELSLREENRQFKTSSDSLFGLGGMVGKSEAMRKVYELVLKAAETESNIIIYGETGSGKDVAARAIHALSGRRGPYVPVNCGAIPESLMESEFFGHTKGAFSGATGNKEGYIGAANNGTLFLDEIGGRHGSARVEFPPHCRHQSGPDQNGPGKDHALGFLLPRACAFHHPAAAARASGRSAAADGGMDGKEGNIHRHSPPRAAGHGTLRLARQYPRAV